MTATYPGRGSGKRRAGPGGLPLPVRSAGVYGGRPYTHPGRAGHDGPTGLGTPNGTGAFTK
ncbi:hypothetical protein SGPA1_10379 [Streptomyces misionensis JCM 4497]